MSSGIYVLYYETDDFMYYVGLSTNLDSRYNDHCSALKRGTHHNRKLQYYYNKYMVLPAKYVLEYIDDLSKLQDREIYWIEQFDSFYNGMNETKGGDKNTYGEDIVTSLYNYDTYKSIFMLLSTTDIPPREISRELNVNEDIVSAIKEGRAHGYFSVEFPELYKVMITKSYNRKLYDDNVYLQVYMDMAYTILTQKEIAEKNGITLSIIKDIARGNTHTYLKDLLPDAYKAIREKEILKYPLFKDPEGNIHEICNMREFCKEYNLTSSNMHKVISKERTSHKGWTLA